MTSSRRNETVHVAFGFAFAATLRKALPMLGSTERVIGLGDSLSVGPIDPPDPNLRQAWGRSVLRARSLLPGELDGDQRDVETAWAAATAPGIDPVFWACLSSSMEHACFLAFAARMDGRPFDIVDATDIDFTTTDGLRGLRSLGMMRPHDVVASNLYATRRRIAGDELRGAAMAWSGLRRENAPFRIVRNSRLVSASLTHYDALLVEQSSHEWEIAARLIGRAITMLSFDQAPTGDDTTDVVLFGRMLALCEDGSLEIAGPGPSMRHYQVRRAVA